MIVVRKEYLSEYGKQTNSNAVITIKISMSDIDYRFKEEILVVDTETNKYISSAAYDTGENKSPQEAVEILMNKLETEFVALGGVCIRKGLVKGGSCQSCPIKSLCDVIHTEYNKELTKIEMVNKDQDAEC